MGLKKNNQTGTKYQYAKIENIQFINKFKVQIMLGMYEKDTTDETKKDLVSVMNFTYDDVETDFDFANLSKAGNNIFTESYKRIKNRAEFLKGFEDDE